MEEESGNSFPFLNVDIKIEGNSVDTWVFRKKTHTGVMLNFSAIVPDNWKTGLIRCLLHSAKRICSSEYLFDQEVENLRRLFAGNGYPQRFFDKVLEKFLTSLQIGDNSEDLEEKEKEDKKYIFGIPFVGKASRDYKKKITELIKEYFQVDIFSYHTSLKVSSFFSLKSKVPFALKARVVYKYTCLSDSDTSYIGKTERHLVTRVNEHLDPKSNHTEVTKHIFDCESCRNCIRSKALSVSNFQILKQCGSDYEARINEALLIKKCSPKLNRQLFTNGQSYLLRVF